jgi:hypothetical protein
LLEGPTDEAAVGGAGDGDNGDNGARPEPSGAPATPPADRVADTTDIAPRPLPDLVAPDARGGARRAVVVVVVLALAATIAVWLRRRRRE